MNNNNLVTEIGMIVLAALLVIGGVVLIFFAKITFADFSPFLVAVLGLFGINVASKAPSVAQAQQIGAVQQQLGSLQELSLNTANAVPQLQAMAHTHSAPGSEPPPAPPQPLYQFIDPGRHFGDSMVMPAVPAQ